MKALTLYQPWAHLVAIGAKTIETRSWKTNYRGELAIHASMNRRFINMRGKDYICATEPFYSVLMACGKPMKTGMIIATCRLVSCEPMPTDTKQFGWQKGINTWVLNDQETAFGDFSAGRYAWLLADIKMLANPLPAKGAMGIWDWYDE